MKSSYADITPVAIQVSRGVVVASIQVDLDDDVLARFREDLLSCVHQADSNGVILDLSGLETLDCHEFAGLRSVIAASKIMGAESILVGLRPGVVSSLVEAGAEIDGLRAAVDLDAAYNMLHPPDNVEPAPTLDEDSYRPGDIMVSEQDAPVQGLERRTGIEL